MSRPPERVAVWVIVGAALFTLAAWCAARPSPADHFFEATSHEGYTP